MITVRPATQRGKADYGWLQARYSFSFANYYDPQFMGFRALRVINEDRVAPGKGFGEHAHNNMEILTYVLEGAIAHKDSMGHGETLRPGEVQYMSAGTGVHHSEFNPSADEQLHLLQIWLEPNATSLQPAYEQKAFPVQREPDRLHLVASTDGRARSIAMHADAELYAGKLNPNVTVRHAFARFSNGWLQVVRGSLTTNGQQLQTGDGASFSNETALTLTTGGNESSEVLFFELG